MHGYSVEEAAEVLGIPQGRVWELIARGVLAGATEGGASMRVFLRDAPSIGAPGDPEDGAEAPTNGNGHRGNGETHPELSPFRELLTEFRNLTERYGQALLALGEARGEVASLRSRVDLLEARMDMRLPMRRASTVAWEMPEAPPQPAAAPAEAPPPPVEEPSQPEATAAGPAESTDAVEPAHEEPLAALEAEALESPELPGVEAEAPRVEPEPRHRRSGSRLAIANLAEALARAEDPALAALPGAQDAADALAALQRQVEASEGEPSEPPEEVAAEAVAAPASDAEQASAAEEEESVAELDALAVAAPSIELAEEAWVAEEAVAEAQPEPAIEEMVDVAAEEAAQAPEPPVAEPVSEETELPASTFVEVEPEHAVQGEPDQPDTEQFEQEAGPMAPETTVEEPEQELEPTATQAVESPYTTDVIEPDWFADGDFAWLDAPADSPPEPPAAEPEQEAPAAESPPEPPAAEPDQEDHAAEGGVESVSLEAEAVSPPEPDEAAHIAAHDEGPIVEEIQEAFQEPQMDAQPEHEPEPMSAEPMSAEPMSAEPETPVDTQDEAAQHDEAVTEEIQEAFEESPRAEAIAIAVEEPRPDAGNEAAPSPEARINGFGLYRGQPEGPSPRGEADSRQATAVRDEEALMWLGEEFEAGDLEVAAPGWRGEEQNPDSRPAEAPPLQLSDAEIEQLASSEGWDQEEVEAIRGLLGRPASRGQAEALPEAGQEADPVGEASSEAGAPRVEPVARRPLPIYSGDREQAADWLRNRRGPAANAYRRLRRLIQG